VLQIKKGYFGSLFCWVILVVIQYNWQHGR
jgi:hypothetical protein